MPTRQGQHGSNFMHHLDFAGSVSLDADEHTAGNCPTTNLHNKDYEDKAEVVDRRKEERRPRQGTGEYRHQRPPGDHKRPEELGKSHTRRASAFKRLGQHPQEGGESSASFDIDIIPHARNLHYEFLH